MNIPLHGEPAISPLSAPTYMLERLQRDSSSGINISLRDILPLLRRQVKLIALTVAIIVAVATAATLAITPMYTAKALVLVDPSIKSILDPSAIQGLGAATDSARVDTEVQIVRSDGVLMQVIEAAQLLSDPEFGVKLGMKDRLAAFLRISDRQPPTGREALGQVLDRLKNSTSAQREGLTYLLSLQATSSDAEKAAKIANVVADIYISRQVQAKVRSVLADRDIIQEQIEQARRTVVDAETSFTDFIFGSIDRIVSITGRTDLSAMTDELAKLTRESNQLSAQIEGLRGSLDVGNWASLASELELEASNELNKRREDLLSRLRTVEATSPTAIDLRSQIADIERSLTTSTNQRLDQLRTTVASNEAAASAARQQLSEAVLASNLPPDILAQLYGLQQVSRNATTSYQTLLARRQNLDTEAALQVAHSRVVSEAIPPNRVSFPNVRLIVVLSGILALAAGVGLAFLFENYIGGFTSSEQVALITGQRLTTVLPRQPGAAGTQSVADAITASPLSRYAEGLRRIRVIIDTMLFGNEETVHMKRGKGTVIMVSSALPNEGKTTVALSLARTYALTGQRVLVIDCDLRKPSIHKHLNVEGTVGLSNVLSTDIVKDDIVRILVRDPHTPLTAIIGSRHSDVPTDQLVASKTFEDLIALATKNFDYIILDSAPIEPVVDGLYLARYADAIVFVIRWATTPQQVVVSAIGRLRSTMKPSAKILPALNQQEGRSASYGRYYSTYYTD
jgi:capsular exopolysaccharide synthesis family protein